MMEKCYDEGESTRPKSSYPRIKAGCSIVHMLFNKVGNYIFMRAFFFKVGEKPLRNVEKHNDLLNFNDCNCTLCMPFHICYGRCTLECRDLLVKAGIHNFQDAILTAYLKYLHLGINSMQQVHFLNVVVLEEVVRNGSLAVPADATDTRFAVVQTFRVESVVTFEQNSWSTAGSIAANNADIASL